MANHAPESSSLFQLNVLIWATIPQPPYAPVKPMLWAFGYRLFSIEQPLEASIVQRANLQARIPPVSIAPVADVLLEHVGSSHFVIMECKPSSFGVESGQTRQARGYILAGSDIAQRGLPAAAKSAEVCYVVPGTDAKAMEDTLVSLQAELKRGSTPVCEVGAVGVTIQKDGVYLGVDHGIHSGGKVPTALSPAQRILAIDSGDDPRPLYVIPWMPESGDEDLSALREKLRAQVLSHIGRSPLGTMELRFDDLLNEVSRGVYSLWRDRESLQGQVNATVGSIVRAMTDGNEAVTVRAGEVTISLRSEEERQALLEQIRTVNVPSETPEGRQLPLEEESP